MTWVHGRTLRETLDELHRVNEAMSRSRVGWKVHAAGQYDESKHKRGGDSKNPGRFSKSAGPKGGNESGEGKEKAPASPESSWAPPLHEGPIPKGQPDVTPEMLAFIQKGVSPALVLPLNDPRTFPGGPADPRKDPTVAVKRFVHTLDAHRDPRTGEFTEERKRLHAKIMDSLFEGKTPVPEGQQPTFVLMGGGSASGKSTIIRSGHVTLPDEDSTVKIDCDEIKAILPEFRPLAKAGEPRSASFVHEESSDLGKAAMRRGFSGRYNVVLDGTGDGSMESLMKKIKAARAAGYRVVANYATVDTDEAVRRSMARAQKEPDRGIVPESVIRQNHAAVSAIFPEAVKAGMFDEARVYDTGVPGGKPQLLFETKDGKQNVVNQEGYSRFLAKANKRG